MAQVKGQAGRLVFVQVVFEDEDDLYLKIQLDNKVLFNHSHTQIEDDGAGKLSIPLLYGVSAPFGVTRTATSYYGIMFNASMNNLSFDNEMIVEAVNRGNAEYDIQGFYVLYGIYKGVKHE